MRSRYFAMLLAFGGVATTATLSGCMVHHHDHEYVAATWSAGEEPYYEQWEHENHKDHVDYAQRSSDDQKSYWDWRKNHHDDNH